MRVLVSRPIPGPALDILKEAGHSLTVLSDERDQALFELEVGTADGVLATLADPIPPDLLVAAPQLRAVANYAVGFNNIDIATCTQLGIPVTNTPDVLTDATADVTMILILMALRRVPESERLLSTGRWQGWRPVSLLGYDLAGKNLGIYGMGRIGQAVARRAEAFGMRVFYHTRSGPKPGLPWPHVSFAALLAESDVLSLHAPLTPQTRGLIGPGELARMKPTAVLINTARGPLVDQGAVAQALRDQRLFAAGFDVYAEEPKVHPALRDAPNTVLLPHIGSSTHETRGAMGRMAAESLLAALAGRRAPNTVNDEVYDSAAWRARQQR